MSNRRGGERAAVGICPHSSARRQRNLDDPFRRSAPAVVEVAVKDGRRWSERVDWATGRRENPMTGAELEAKFFDLATTRMPKQDADRLMAMIRDLEKVQNVRRLGDLLRG